MKKILMTLLGAGLLMFGGIGIVGADFIETDFLATGDSLLTYDEDTGLEWLDLNLTVGQSYASIMAVESHDQINPECVWMKASRGTYTPRRLFYYDLLNTPSACGGEVH